MIETFLLKLELQDAKKQQQKNPKHIFSFSLGENTVKTELSYSVPSLHKNSSHVATQTKLFIPAFLSANAFYEFAPASFTWTQRILAFSRDTNSRINRGFLLVWLTLSWNDELTDQKVHFLIISVFFFFFKRLKHFGFQLVRLSLGLLNP